MKKEKKSKPVKLENPMFVIVTYKKELQKKSGENVTVVFYWEDELHSFIDTAKRCGLYERIETYVGMYGSMEIL